VLLRQDTTSTPQAKRGAESTVRVASERLDGLVDLVGELVITQSRLQSASENGAPGILTASIEAMERLIGDLRDRVLAMRMVPIGATFKRFTRLVRDLSSELGKPVEFVTEGDETELDKTVTDQIGDALVHILRNSMDHGLESPDARTAAGKPAQGTLRLSARYEGASAIIEVRDDGRGIDPVVIRRKAEAKGLVSPTATLTESETLGLIMLPGFSTAESVTHLSGRGVGMDVVKKTIESLRGTISLSSKPGVGTVISLSLPLTLAIIDGLLVQIGGERYVVPMGAVLENLELMRSERSLANGRNVVSVRGEMVTYIRLRELYGFDDDGPALQRIVVVAHDGQRVGLVVDRVLGSHQTVIQPLGRMLRGTELFSGSTILGDGGVAMILDINGTIEADGASKNLHRISNTKGIRGIAA
jgi:two-component system chemotaxis sensor kinase CheA